MSTINNSDVGLKLNTRKMLTLHISLLNQGLVPMKLGEKKMTKILLSSFDSMVAMCERIGRARAASELARNGYYTQAKRLMTDV